MVEQQEEREDSPLEEVWVERAEKAFTKNEITRTNYLKIKTAGTRQEKIDEMHGFIQEELSDLEVIPREIKALLRQYEMYSAISGGKRTRQYIETQLLRVLQEVMRHLWKVKQFEPDNVEESVLVKGVDGRPEGYARYAKDFDLEKSVREALEKKEEEKKEKGSKSELGSDEEKKD